MGKRFILARYPLEHMSDWRKFMYLNEYNYYTSHSLRPYGWQDGNFRYRNMFEKVRQSRIGRKNAARCVKKAARQQAKRELQEMREEL